MSKKRKRAPIAQLREAGNVAKQMLIDRGILAKESVIDKILKDPKAPVLPGMPEYLPHRWTIEIAQRIMYDLLREWQWMTAKDENRQEDLSQFFTFVIKRMQEEENKAKVDLKAMKKSIKSLEQMSKIPVLSEVFSPLRRKDSAKGLHKFFIDSMAVSIIVKQNDSTSKYAEWFLQWTAGLYKLWGKEKKSK